MATVLLIVIYIAFIGLGIPDSLFGAAWPAIYPELQLPIASASYVTLLISGSTVLSSLFSARLIQRLGTGWVTVISTLMTAVALLGFSFSGGMLWFCLLAIPLGLGAGTIDVALNNYVALHYRATQMNFLHCFYGVGVTLSPYLMSLTLSGSAGWRGGYRTVFWIQLGIAAVTVLVLPFWGRVQGAEETTDAPARALSLREMGRMPAVRTVWLVFIGSCAIEYICGVWGSTFLVNSKELPVEKAAEVITFYYLGMTLGRFLSGVLANRMAAWRLIQVGQGLTLAAILLLLLPLPVFAAGAALFLIGVGNGPLFPNLTYLTPQNFGRDISQSVMGTQMAAGYVGILLAPPLFGILAQQIDIGLFPWFLLAMFVLMSGATRHLLRLLPVDKGDAPDGGRNRR